MYALGRNLQYYDVPAVRAIVRDAARDNYTLFFARDGDREERAISDESTESRPAKIRRSRSCSSRRRRCHDEHSCEARGHAGAAVPRCHDSGALARPADRRLASASSTSPTA